MKFIVLSLLIILCLFGSVSLAQNDRDSLLQQMAEQAIPLSNGYDSKLLNGTNEPGSDNETYQGIKNFWNVDIVGNFFANIGQVIGRWLAEGVNGWLAETVRFLTTYLRTFVLNPNVLAGLSQNQSQNSATGSPDDISPFVQQGINVMYAIALDLLLILFILSIWRYWTESAWTGGGSLFGAVGRLIFTISIILAWRSLYVLEIQVSNEMIQAIYFHSSDQVQALDVTMGNLVKSGLVANSSLVAPSLGNVSDPNSVSSIGGAVGGLISFVGLIIFLLFALVLIAQLLIILVLKAMQTALLAVQYMFAPFFLVFFATSDTASIASGYIKSFIEVSLWTFIWVGLLKIMTILLFANMSPWGKIVLAIGVMQLMVQAPSFLAKAKLSPLSSVVAGGLMNRNALSQAFTLGHTMVSNAGRLISGSKSEGPSVVSVAISSLPKLAWRTDAANRDMPLSVSVLKPLGLPRPASLSMGKGSSSFGTTARNQSSRSADADFPKKLQSALEGQMLSSAKEPGLCAIETAGEEPLADWPQVNKAQDSGPMTALPLIQPAIKDGYATVLLGASVDPDMMELASGVQPDLNALQDSSNSQSQSMPMGSIASRMQNEGVTQSELLRKRQPLFGSTEPDVQGDGQALLEKSRIPGLRNLANTSISGSLLGLGVCVNPIALSRCLNPDPTTNASFSRDLNLFSTPDSANYVDHSHAALSDPEPKLNPNKSNVESDRSTDSLTAASNFVRHENASSPIVSTLKPPPEGCLSGETTSVRFSSVFLTEPEMIAPQVSSKTDDLLDSADTTLSQSGADFSQIPMGADSKLVLGQNARAREVGCQGRLDCRTDPIAMNYITSDLKAAGFQDHHLQNPQIVETMLELYEKNSALLYGGADPVILHSAALAANILPPAHFTEDNFLNVYKELLSLP